MTSAVPRTWSVRFMSEQMKMSGKSSWPSSSYFDKATITCMTAWVVWAHWMSRSERKSVTSLWRLVLKETVFGGAKRLVLLDTTTRGEGSRRQPTDSQSIFHVIMRVVVPAARLLLLLDLNDRGLGGEEEGGDAGRVLEGDAFDLGWDDHAHLDHVAE